MVACALSRLRTQGREYEQGFLRTALLLSLLFIVFVAALYAGLYVYLSDCAEDGVRASKWIDDMDRTSACLPQLARTVGLIGVPVVWAAVSLALVIASRKGRVL